MQAVPPSADEDFDPTRVLDGWRPHRAQGSPEPDLAALRAAAGRSLAPERVAALRQRGFPMRDVEDVECVERTEPDWPDTVPMHLL